MAAESENKRLAKNTLILYARTFVMLVISLFTVRVVFNVLGAEDYGIQNVVSGFVAMFMFVTNSLSVTFSRFFSLALGRKEEHKVSSIFSTAIIILFCLAIVIVVAVEAVGIPFLNYKMNIPNGRMSAANWVLQMSILTIFFNMLTTAYDALIISYEKMSAYAYVSIFDAVLKMLFAYLVYLSPADKLMTYSSLLFIHSVLLRVVYGIYCHRKFRQCRFKFAIDKPLIKEIVGLTSWDLLGALSSTLKNYGIDIVINIFCGVLVNAARGIASQVNSAVARFSQGFLTAIRPQIYKAYAAGNRERLEMLVNNGTRCAMYLLLLISLPIAFQGDFILNLWLGNVPEHSVNFVRLVLLLSICEGAMPYCPNAAMMATGKIRNYQLSVSLIRLMNVPLAILLLYLNLPPESVLICAVILSAITNVVCAFFLKRRIQYSIRKFVGDVCLRFVMVFIASSIVPYLLMQRLEHGWLSFIVVIIVTFICTATSIAYIGCSRQERQLVKAKVATYIKKKK